MLLFFSQKFVNVVKVNVNTMDELVNKAENEMGSLSGIKNMLSSLLGSVSTGFLSEHIVLFHMQQIYS